jgi:pilus assembly protein Flp/PilA
MTKLRSFIPRSFLRLLADESGATAIEYALIAAGVGAAIVASVVAAGGTVKGMYDKVSAAFSS